tara:strand:- start:5574 stop:6032 length:459 start_codon:yes stop_codon:yes gene_type:complete
MNWPKELACQIHDLESYNPWPSRTGKPRTIIVLDTILAYQCTLRNTRYDSWGMATRQNSANGNPKSPRVQVVLPEDICDRLTKLAERESRTVSNMAKVLIQEGLKRYEQKEDSIRANNYGQTSITEKFRSSLESQQPKRLKGAPRRMKFLKP